MFKTHNDAYIEIGGTHLQGYIRADYAALVKAFGKPHDGDGYKVDWEWDILFEDGTVATIYNWKNGPNYGYEGVGPSAIMEWNVGGHSNVVPRIARILGTQPITTDDMMRSFLRWA